MQQRVQQVFKNLGIEGELSGYSIGDKWLAGEGGELVSYSPIDGSELGRLKMPSTAQANTAIDAAADAFEQWKIVPAPIRGELVRILGERLRAHKEDLATLVSLEAGKITQEALGEVQEMIDICDFAVGQSRQLYGKSIASERPLHRLTEQWHPLGTVGVVTAFNFPVAVWAWNAALAFVCGDPVVWKPSKKVPLCAIACQAIFQQALKEVPDVPPAISVLLVCGRDVGQAIVESPKLPLISATGSVAMGRAIGQSVAGRLGKSLLELGGNNGMIVAPSADMDLAVRSAVFSAVGTCGQRCTSLRRIFAHESIADEMLAKLQTVYNKLPIGDPTVDGKLVGPLIDEGAFNDMENALKTAKAQGGTVHGGGRATDGVPENGYYVHPAIVEISHTAEIVQQETFAPIVYFMRYKELTEAITAHNAVPQGLSSAIVTGDVREAEMFCSPAGSDCGIANVNIGTSGAEIGGAFGGEKETGGGRESGSDSWKIYMRRATNTINYSTELPLAQGIKFDV